MGRDLVKLFLGNLDDESVLDYLKLYNGSLVEALKRLNEQKDDSSKRQIIENIVRDNGHTSSDSFFLQICNSLLDLSHAWEECNAKNFAVFNEKVISAVNRIGKAYSFLKAPEFKKDSMEQEGNWSSPVNPTEKVDKCLSSLLQPYESYKQSDKDTYYKIRYVLALTSSLFRAISPNDKPEASRDNKLKEHMINAVIVADEREDTDKKEDKLKGVVLNLFVRKSNVPGWGMILPDPSSIFIPLKEKFFQGIKRTNELLASEMGNNDVFWRLECDRLREVFEKGIDGGSMGACFYTLIRTVLRKD